MDDSDEEDDAYDLANEYFLAKKASTVKKIKLCSLLFNEINHEQKKRQPKTKRDRAGSWQTIESWSNQLFYRQFRMTREDFLITIERMKSIYPGPKKNGIDNYLLALRKGHSSTPESGPITIEIKLAITLRLLAGASYLDMIWYGVQIDSVIPIFIKMLPLLNDAYPDKEIYNFDPSNSNFEEECRMMANDWSCLMQDKKGDPHIFKGTLLAGDGCVIPQKRPTDLELAAVGLVASDFRNRKGCYANNMEAFCDAWARFRFVEIAWPGATNDITCHKQSAIYQWFLKGWIPECYHWVLDEAYNSIGGNMHLTPFSRAQLLHAKSSETPEAILKYEQMKCFNNYLSSQRITIERAFGMLIRKWGILWSPLEHSLEVNCLIVKVCTKLHNVCINTWMKKGAKKEQIHLIDRRYMQKRDAGAFLGWTVSDSLSEFDITENDVQHMLHNPNQTDIPAHRVMAQRKEEIMTDLYRRGFRYDVNEDNDFTLNRTMTSDSILNLPTID